MSRLPIVFHMSDDDQHHSLINNKFLTENLGDKEALFRLENLYWLK